MKAYLINMHLLVPRSRSSKKVKVKYKGYISQKMTVLGAFVFHTHILFSLLINPSPHHAAFWRRTKDKAVENIVRKGEIACYKQFLLFLQCFLPYVALFFHFK